MANPYPYLCIPIPIPIAGYLQCGWGAQVVCNLDRLNTNMNVNTDNAFTCVFVGK